MSTILFQLPVVRVLYLSIYLFGAIICVSSELFIPLPSSAKSLCGVNVHIWCWVCYLPTSVSGARLCTPSTTRWMNGKFSLIQFVTTLKYYRCHYNLHPCFFDIAVGLYEMMILGGIKMNEWIWTTESVRSPNLRFQHIPAKLNDGGPIRTNWQRVNTITCQVLVKLG